MKWTNEYIFHQHRYNTVKTVKSRTVSTRQKGSKSTQSCLKRYVNEDLTVGYFVCLMITILSILYNLLATLLFGSLTIAIFNKLTYLRTLAKNVIAIASARWIRGWHWDCCFFKAAAWKREAGASFVCILFAWKQKNTRNTQATMPHLVY